LFILIALETSMRRTEILSIKLTNIDLKRKIIFIPKAKAGAREQPITEHLAEVLQYYLDNAECGQVWLFPSNLSRTGYVTSIEVPFRRVVKRAGLNPKEVVRHTLRHTAITHLVQAGVDLPTVQRISGHKTLQMVVRYSHQNGEHIRSAMDVLEKRYDLETDAV
jgi:integrase